MSANGGMPPVVEVVQVAISRVGALPIPGNAEAIILTFTLPNGRQYQFPLDATGRKAVAQLVSTVQVYGPEDLPG